MGYNQVVNVGTPDGIQELLVARISTFSDGTIIILPTSLDSDRGIYRAELLTVPKALRAAGVPAEFLHGPDERVFLSEHSVPEAIAVFAVGVSQNMTWDAVKAIWTYAVSHVRTLRSSSTPSVGTIEFHIALVERPGLKVKDLHFKGPAEPQGVADFYRHLFGEPPDGQGEADT